MANAYYVEDEDVVPRRDGDEDASDEGPEALAENSLVESSALEKKLAGLIDAMLVLIIFLSMLAAIY